MSIYCYKEQVAYGCTDCHNIISTCMHRALQRQLLRLSHLQIDADLKIQIKECTPTYDKKKKKNSKKIQCPHCKVQYKKSRRSQ